MYNLSERELALWQHPYPQTCVIKSDDFTITEADITSGGMTIDRTSVSGSSIEIGSVIASELTLTLDNHDGKWNSTSFEGKSLSVQVSTEDRVDASHVPMGYFVIDNAPRRLKTITLTALDRMMQFDRTYTSGITFPTTPETIVRLCCTACDVPLGVSDFSGFQNHNVAITETDLTDKTYREILSYALEIMCVNGWANENGQFTCGWYKTPVGNTLQCAESNRTTSDLADDPVTIDGVQIDDDKYLTGSSSGSYLINVESNPFITDDNRDTIGSGLLAVLNGFSYYPASATMLPCPHLWPMDILTFVKNEVEYQIIITGVNYQLNGMTVISSDGETATTSGYASANPLTKAEEVIIHEIEVEQTSLGKRVTDLSSINDIASNALGFHTTVETQNDGSIIEYTHDKTNLADSTIIYKKTSEGFFLSQDGGQTYTSGFDSSGNAVLNILSVNGINADWISAGILKDAKSLGGHFWLNLNTGELNIGNGELHYEIDESTGRGTLSLGGPDASVKMTIDNDSVDLISGGQTIATFGATEAVIPRLNVQTTMDLGNWQVDHNGGFSIKWIGG